MVFIGRETGCEVVLSDVGVSGRHVKVTERDGRYFVEDWGSENGTLLDGTLLAGQVELKGGESLGIGTAVVTVTIDTDDTIRKRVTPSSHARKPTGEIRRATGEVRKATGEVRKAFVDDEATLPVGKPLAKGDLPAPVPRASAPRPSTPSAVKRGPTYVEADTDKTSPVLVSAKHLLGIDLPPAPKPKGEATEVAPVPSPKGGASTEVMVAAPFPVPKGGASTEVMVAAPFPVPKGGASTEVMVAAPFPVAKREAATEAMVAAAFPVAKPGGKGTGMFPEMADLPAEPPTDAKPLPGEATVLQLVPFPVGKGAPPVPTEQVSAPFAVASSKDASGVRSMSLSSALAAAGVPESPDRVPTQQAHSPNAPSPSESSRLKPPVPVDERERKTTLTDPRERATVGAPAGALPPEPMTQVPLGGTGPLLAHTPVNPPTPQGPPAVLLEEGPTSSMLGVGPEPTQVQKAAGWDDATDPDGKARAQLPAAESAADRARRRREAEKSLGGQLAFFWSEMSLRTRLVISGVLGTVVLILIIGLWQVFRPPPRPELPAEPTVLSSNPVNFSFGLGDGVDYEHADFKELTFTLNAPTAAAVIVHYRAQDISGSEVSVSVNGNESGFVPADQNMPDRDIETLLMPFALKRNEPNEVVFDNTKNPPGKERWRVSNLWMELIPVPDVPREVAVQTARQANQAALLLEKQRNNGDDTLFRTWQTYRRGWTALLALRDEESAGLLAQMKRRSDALKVELDVQCGTIMLDAKKQMELKSPENAKEILEGVSRYFPTREHSCPHQAEEKIREYDL